MKINVTPHGWHDFEFSILNGLDAAVNLRVLIASIKKTLLGDWVSQNH